ETQSRNQRETEAESLAAAGKTTDIIPTRFHPPVVDVSKPPAEYREPITVSHLDRLLFQKIDQPRVRIESHNPHRIRNEVRKSVDVVILQLAVPVVNKVLDSAHIDAGGFGYGLHRFNDLRRRSVAFDLKTVFRCIDGTGVSIQFNARSRPTDVRRAKIKSLAGSEDLDRIEILPAECFDSDDMRASSRNKFLDKRSVVYAEVDALFFCGERQIECRVIANNPGTASAHIGFDDNGE